MFHSKYKDKIKLIVKWYKKKLAEYQEIFKYVKKSQIAS